VTIPNIEFGVEIQVFMDCFCEKHKKVIGRDFVVFLWFTNLELDKKFLGFKFKKKKLL
jgi:hypothetical protein